MLENFRKEVFYQHDVVCNQKYGDNLPYSFHLKTVEAQMLKFKHLIEKGSVVNKNNFNSRPVSYKEIVCFACCAHDIIEDGRTTYNDLRDMVNTEDFGNYTAATMIADIVYCLTDEKGKNRSERKNEKYYKELSENKYAVFVKLADIAANTLYSKLTGSSMYDKYKKEFPNFKEKVYIEEYKEFFNYVENL